MPDRPSFDEIRSYNSCRDYAERVFSTSPKHHHKYDVYPCPNHSERTPSFTVYEDGFKCYGSCGQSGSVIDLAMLMENLSLEDAAEMLARNVPGYTGNDHPLPKRTVRKALPAPEPEKPKDLPFSLVQAQYKGIAEVVPYFNERAVSTPTAHQRLLGKNNEFRSCYETLTKRKLWFSSPRYAIPNVFGLGTDDPKVRAINYRRNDVWCLEALNRVDFGDIVVISEDMRERYFQANGTKRWPTEAELIDAIYSKKYRQETGSSRSSIFNADALAYRDDEHKVVYRHWEFMIVVAEGKEIDQMAIMDAGWPSIAVPDSDSLLEQLPKILAHIDLIFIAGDNDGGTGFEKAYKVQRAIGRGTVMIPDKFKDHDEVVIAGEADHWFVDKWGIPPILRGA